MGPKGDTMYQPIAASQPMSPPTIQEVHPLRTLVLTEELPAGIARGVEAATVACHAEALFYQKPADLLRELGESGADVVVIPGSHGKAEEICAAVRQLAGMQVALIGVARQVDALAFAEFVGWGGDDLIVGDSGRSFAARLRAVRQDRAEAGPRRIAAREDGRFLVVAPQGSEILASARLIERTGHRAVVVDSLNDGLARLAFGRDIRVVVDARLPGALHFVDRALRLGNCVGIVLACPPQQLGQLSKRFESEPRVIVLDSCSPADAVLLAANLLAAPSGARRSTERLLYSTIVRFREVGSEYDHLGCTYNVSAGGLYVRTLALPKGQQVWVEIVPPGSMDRVRLEGRVAWRTPISRDASCPTPVGFGIQISDGSKQSLKAWQAGYRALQRKLEIAPERPTKVARISDRPTDPDLELNPFDPPTVRDARSGQRRRVGARAPAKLDQSNVPTVRPPSAARRIVWSSMTTGTSATFLASQAVPFQQAPQVAAVDARTA